MATTYNNTVVNIDVPKLVDGRWSNLTALKKAEKLEASYTANKETGEPELEIESLRNIEETDLNEVITPLLAKHGLPEAVITKGPQTFQYAKVTNASDLLSLIQQYNQDEASANEAAASIINRGLTLAQQKAARDFMFDDDQQCVDGAYDLMTDANKPGERRKADPASKALKAISDMVGTKVDADFLAQIIAQIQQAQAVAQ